MKLGKFKGNLSPAQSRVALPAKPKRTEVSDELATRFEENAPAGTPKAATLATSAKRPKTSRMRRDIVGERMTIYIPPEVASRLRVRCAQERYSLSGAITELVEKWLASQSTKTP